VCRITFVGIICLQSAAQSKARLRYAGTAVYKIVIRVRPRFSFSLWQ
jgi:hypothetical protein